MGRIIGSVIVGYITMAVGVFVLFSAAYVLLGAGASFRPGSWDVSAEWITVSIAVGIVAALAGGYIAAVIARSPTGPRSLAVVVLILGLLVALPVLLGTGETATGPRPESVGLFNAMQNAQQPTWIALLNPLLGALGVMIGARLKRSGSRAGDYRALP